MKAAYKPQPDGFYPVLKSLRQNKAWTGNRKTARQAEAALNAAAAAPAISHEDFAALLSPALMAGGLLEAAAQCAHAQTVRHFGRTIQLFTPLYIANFCTNRCVYCGFSQRRSIPRRKLSLEEIDKEGQAIAATGLRKVLVLTGDAPTLTGSAYLAEAILALAPYFPSIGVEVPSMRTEEYALLARNGADSMTMFQETYDPALYGELHPAGPKRDFALRLDSPRRALDGGLRGVNLGPLLGLANDWREDVFYCALHAEWLTRRYPEAEVSISFPRMQSHAEGGEAPFMPAPVSDADLVQAIVAVRCFLPQIGITLSTRESAALRDALMPLGITRMSAGVCTAVGGHTDAEDEGTPQFDISDPRSVPEMVAAIQSRGYQSVFTDWLVAPETARTEAGAGHAGL